MRYLIAFTLALLSVTCSQPHEDPVVEHPEKIPATIFPTASCPNHKDVTWCLLFSDGSSASVTITQDVPKTVGFLGIGNHMLPFEGEVDLEKSSFSLHLIRNYLNWEPAKGVVQGKFPTSFTQTEGEVKFYFASEAVKIYQPDSFPKDITYDSKQSVTGTWMEFPQPPTLAAQVDIVQHGKLILMVNEYVLKGETLVFLWPGLRNALSYTFPKEEPTSDSGTWIDGSFSSDLTMATGVSCADNIERAKCQEVTWYRQ